MGLQFGVFDHIEPVPGSSLNEIYEKRLLQIERFDAAGFYAYHLAEHHSPAVHSLAPSQNVFLAAVSQRTSRLRVSPCVYVLPLHHPLRLIEEICMLDNLSGGRMEIGVGRGGVMEAYFWGQEDDSETNYARYLETLAIIKEGLSHDELTYEGRFHSFDALPMRLRPVQRPYPPLWYMRNPETAALEGMNTIIVGT
ncbi:MAG: LLM class flavin-dependent oxidoreductase, partial [Chloroflexi bacterium]|nr:LLM class flavin-dependent oxidoreductase [Chloroflexota bacterium]